MNTLKTLLTTLTLSFLLVCGLSAQASELQQGQMAMGQGDMPGALAHFQAAAEATPEDAETLYFLGLGQFLTGDHASAKETLKKAKTLNPNVAKYHSMYGAALSQWAQTLSMMEAGMHHMEAKVEFQKAVDLDPKDQGGHQGLAYSYFYTPEQFGGSIVKAEEHATILKEISPADGCTLLGMIRAKQGKTEEARAFYEEALASNPHSQEAKNGLSALPVE